MSRRTVAAAVIVVLAAAAAAYWWFGGDDQSETVRVERGSIDVTIETVGSLELAGNQTVRARTAGTVVAVGVVEGDSVSAGDVLVVLDHEELDQLVEDAERSVEAAEFNLQFAELRAAEEPDSLAFQQGVLEARAQLDTTSRGLATALERQAAGAILAGEDGIVLELLVAVGDRVADRQAIATLYERDDLRLIADVDELDLPNITTGADVQFRLDAQPALDLSGVVVRTAPQAVQRGGATIFPTEISFEAPAEADLRPGMNAAVTIVTDLRENVLLAPERAIRTVGQRAFVTVRDNGAERDVEIVLGFRGAGVAEVVEGLDEGDSVVLR
jgi:RND family efflux transporter MFP subunit